jgi:hypothetical protein
MLPLIETENSEEERRRKKLGRNRVSSVLHILLSKVLGGHPDSALLETTWEP